MVEKTVHWSLRANRDKLAIFEYWINRNRSITYAQKLERLFNEAMKLAATFPEAGTPTNTKKVRYRQIRHFKIFYQISEKSLIVLLIWDDRRDTANLPYLD
ncbi:type II toxin-antitoxin system RelE/ParE family toxin [Halocola ammonii]